MPAIIISNLGLGEAGKDDTLDLEEPEQLEATPHQHNDACCGVQIFMADLDDIDDDHHRQTEEVDLAKSKSGLDLLQVNTTNPDEPLNTSSARDQRKERRNKLKTNVLINSVNVSKVSDMMDSSIHNSVDRKNRR